MKGRRLPAVVVGAGLALSFLASPTFARTTPTLASFPTKLTAKEAVQVVVQFFRQNNQSNSTLSTADQNLDEEGIAVQMDNANFHILSLEGQTTAGTSALPKTNNIAVYLTSATRPPAEFLAAIKYPAVTTPTASPGGVSYFVFRKDSSKAPWRALYYESVSQPTTAPAITTNGIDATIKSGVSNATMKRFAGYLNLGDEKGFAKGTYTSQADKTLIADSNAAPTGSTLTFTFRPDATSPVVGVAVKGGTLEFGGLKEQQVTAILPGSGTCAVDSQSGDSANYLALVPPNIAYTKIVVNVLAQAAIFVPSKKHQVMRVLDVYYQLVNAETPLASGCSSTPNS